MKYRSQLSIIVAAVTAFVLLSAKEPSAQEEAVTFAPEQIEFFEKKVRPVLADHCFKCHGKDDPEGDLRLDSRAGALRGGNSGPAVVPGKLDAGEFLLAISYDPDGYQMPPAGKLPDDQIADLKRWVEMGAPWPAEEAAPENDRIPKNIDAAELARRAQHWCFQPLVRHPLPAVKNINWVRSPIDRFILAKLEAYGLTPADEADKSTWLRRVYFDTIGLPPTPEQLAAFLADEQPGTEERVIDGLLSNPHFGERWGRHWLDLVRYAESRGHEFDYDVANPWHYRDYVIRAINDDVPYNQFVVEHVAGDLCPRQDNLAPGESPGEFRYPTREHPLTGANESIVASGFWYLGEWIHSPVDIRQDEADRFDNMIDVYSKTFLGLTVACARCHDHKFDPITQKDFYALQGYLQSSAYRQARFETMENNRRVADVLRKIDLQAAQAVLVKLREKVDPVLNSLDQYILVAATLAEPHQKAGTNVLNEADLQAISIAAIKNKLNTEVLRAWVEDSLPNPAYNNTLALNLERNLAQDQRPAQEASANPQVDYKQYQTLNLALMNGPSTAFDLVVNDARDRLFDDQLHHKSVWYRPSAAHEYWEYKPELNFKGSTDIEISEAGSLGTWGLGEAVLRTATFEIKDDKLFCLIQGGVNCYLAVDSHVLIKGPLHGSLIKEFPAQAGWHWIELETSRYIGHRAHLEFYPRQGEQCRISLLSSGAALPWSDLPSDQYWQNGMCEAYRVWFDDDYTIDDLKDLVLEKVRVFRRNMDPKQSGSVAWELVFNHLEAFGLNQEELRILSDEVLAPFRKLKQEMLSGLKPFSATCPAMIDISPEDEYVFLRGNWKKRGEVVPRRFLEVFGGARDQEQGARSSENPSDNSEDISLLLDSHSSLDRSSGRYELALQMVDPEQTPIVSRVIVNRIWQHYFGRGIVPTPDDFGHLGQLPTHPELLDWLATELVAHNWSLKHIHQLILSSAAYRMQSEERGAGSEGSPSSIDHQRSTSSPLTSNPSPLTSDPDNLLFHRMNVKRMEGEVIRDAVLSVSGRLDEVMYGKSSPVYLTPFMEGRGRPGESGPVDNHGRRSLYIAVRRNFPDPFLQAFDFPNPHSTIGRRSVSNVPAQALTMMNNPLIVQEAERWGKRVLEVQNAEGSQNSEGGTRKAAGEPPSSIDHQPASPSAVDLRVQQMFLAAFSRQPTAIEAEQARGFLESQSQSYGCDLGDPRPWNDYAHVLLNLKEFIFVR